MLDGRKQVWCMVVQGVWAEDTTRTKGLSRLFTEDPSFPESKAPKQQALLFLQTRLLNVGLQHKSRGYFRYSSSVYRPSSSYHRLQSSPHGRGSLGFSGSQLPIDRLYQ